VLNKRVLGRGLDLWNLCGLFWTRQWTCESVKGKNLTGWNVVAFSRWILLHVIGWMVICWYAICHCCEIRINYRNYWYPKLSIPPPPNPYLDTNIFLTPVKGIGNGERNFRWPFGTHSILKYSRVYIICNEKSWNMLHIIVLYALLIFGELITMLWR
jgi:hypothetical protein